MAPRDESETVATPAAVWYTDTVRWFPAMPSAAVMRKGEETESTAASDENASTATSPSGAVSGRNVKDAEPPRGISSSDEDSTKPGMKRYVAGAAPGRSSWSTSASPCSSVSAVLPSAGERHAGVSHSIASGAVGSAGAE